MTLEKEHDNVNIGKLLHEDRYKRDSKEITIDQTISIDFIRKGDFQTNSAENQAGKSLVKISPWRD
ncbi:MAG: Dna2/Cas4 domain-containing protein [Candidatus Methanoperedens sp.]|nr:Dna2/Cas4 domain-containing protein [Candidatus Methanoperedens sp.]